jgi:1,4-dihydroxy-2-naphthoyl-CoA synthase
MNKEYIAGGIVYGKNWGGGFGAYPSRELRAKNKAELFIQARAELKTGGLDSGMGFEYLTKFIGNLTDKEKDFLVECQF